jgi:hypothetical protein
MMEIRWLRERDTTTCENIHIMYDGPFQIATIRNKGKGPRRFEVQIKKNTPWHRRSLQSAKSDCEWVYINTKR